MADRDDRTQNGLRAVVEIETDPSTVRYRQQGFDAAIRLCGRLPGVIPRVRRAAAFAFVPIPFENPLPVGRPGPRVIRTVSRLAGRTRGRHLYNNNNTVRQTGVRREKTIFYSFVRE